MNALADQFDRKVRALENHIQVTGQDPNVPYNCVAADGTQLGSWLITLRANYRKGRLPPEPVARLTALGVDLQRVRRAVVRL